jgi:predicted RNase H-like nuclease (RuvC/YqgF family)
MAITKTLDQYISEKSKFDLTDIFGKGRIREAMYEYHDLKKRTSEELEKNKTIMYAQAQSVTDLVGKIRGLEEENAYLKSYIRETDTSKNSLLEKKVKAENLAEKYHEEALTLAEKNGTLLERIAKLEKDYQELSEVHDGLIEKIKNTPDPNQLMIEDLL